MTAVYHPPAAVPQLDVEALLAPPPDGLAAAGRPTLEAILEAAREDDPNLPQGVWVADQKRADWKEVVALSTAYLTQHGKHLQVAAALLEGLVGLYGFAGIAPGLEVIAGLCDRYGAVLEPLPDEDGDDTVRANVLLRLDRRLPLRLARLPLSQPGPQHAGKPPVCWDDYQRALFTEKARRRLGDAAKPGDNPMAAFDAAIAETPTGALQAIRSHLVQAESVLAHTQIALAGVCSDAKLSGAARAMAEIRNWIENVLTRRGVLTPEPGAMDAADEEGAEAGPPEEGGGRRTAMRISGRDHAYTLLAEIADYLAITEPHSPTPYLLRRAVAWGNMPLHELLTELSQGRNDLATVFAMLGITGQK
jgi:type VI secretion system ImpA family protein